MKTSELRNLLITFGLCAAVVTACTDNKGNNDAAQQEAITAANSEAAKNQELNAALEQQMAELEADRQILEKEKRDAEIAIASMKYKATKEREAVEADAKAHAFARADREAEIAQLSQQIEQASAKLNRINKMLAENLTNLAKTRTKVNLENARLQALLLEIAEQRAAADAEAEQHRLMLLAMSQQNQQEIEQALAKHRSTIESERKAWNDKYSSEVARLRKEVATAQNNVAAAKAQAELDNILAGEALLKQQERIMGETEAKVKAMNDKVEAEVAQKRADYNSEEEARRAVVAGMQAEAQAKLNLVEQKATELEIQRQQVAHNKAQNEARTAELDQMSDALLQDRHDFNQVLADFSRKVAGMRKFWEEKGLGEIWKNVRAGDTYTFRMVLLGNAAIHHIETLRHMIGKAHEGNDHIDQVKYKVNDPVFIKETGDHNKDRQTLRKTENGQLFNNRYHQTAVNDSLLIKGRVEEISELVNRLNSEIGQIASRGDRDAANMIVEAFPVEKVRVTMDIDFYGSARYHPDKRELFKIGGFRFTPLTSDIDVLENVDLDNPASYFAKSINRQLDCQVIDVDCLVDLKKSGLLSQVGELTYTDQNGEKHIQRELSFAQAIDELMLVSQKKIDVMATISKLREEGLSIDISRENRVKTRRTGFLWLNEEKYIEADEKIITQIAAGNKAYDAYLERLANLSGQPLLEKITLSYSVVAVDEVKGIRDSLSLKFTEAVKVSDDSIKLVSYVHKLGEFETALPIPEVEKSESNFQDLSLKDFDHGIAQQPEVRDQEEGEDSEEYSAYLTEYIAKKKEIDKDIADARRLEFYRRVGILERDFDYIRGKMAEVAE